MLLCNTDIKIPFRHFLLEYIKPCAIGHSGCDTYNSFILFADFNKSITENFCICRHCAFFFWNESCFLIPWI